MITWLTPQEKKVLLFILFCFFVGILVSRYLKLHPLAKESFFSEGKKTSLVIQKVNINSADFSQLVSIPGIGPVLAEAILEYRKIRGPFREMDQLKEIKGIGEKKLREIVEYIVLE
ncbi:MAG: helix-hairpin-helix domain-containing protein [Candidatus Omnitrophica bacterium]|nr:helix-hairpin-helix domain-containing protein [Candidatus Omnitrophota bacterium]